MAYKNHTTGKELEDHKTELDQEAAEAAWPNFKVFHANFKNHPALGPGFVEDSAAAPHVPSAASEVEIADDNELEPFSLDNNTHCQSRASTTCNDSEEENEQQEEEDAEEDEVESVTPPAKKRKDTKVTTTTRIHPKKDRISTSTIQFLAAFTSTQETFQTTQMEHEKKMQAESMAFQAKQEQDCIQFESEMAMQLQQSSSAFQQQMLQSNQPFQAIQAAL